MCPPEPPFPLAKGIFGKQKTPNTLHPYSNENATGLPDIPEANTAPVGITKPGVRSETVTPKKARGKKTRR